MKWEDLGIKGEGDLEITPNVGETFGKENQLTILGRLVAREVSDKQSRRHVVECSVCKQDPELFGDGIFAVQLGNLCKGLNPCGCSVSPKWTEKQMKVRAMRICLEKGYTFISWNEPYKANITRIKILNEFSEPDTIRLCALLRGENSSSNRRRMTSLARSKPDKDVIETFMSSGSFHADSKFWKSERIDDVGQRSFWWMECGACGVIAESYRSNLQKGKRPCGCTKFVGQKNMYINLIYDGSLPIGLKFGKTHFPERRIKEQQSKSQYSLESYGVWEFEEGSSTTKAEGECKNSFTCGVIPFEMMQDGWSETTYVYNLDAVISIYQNNGGVKI